MVGRVMPKGTLMLIMGAMREMLIFNFEIPDVSTAQALQIPEQEKKLGSRLLKCEPEDKVKRIVV